MPPLITTTYSTHDFDTTQQPPTETKPHEDHDPEKHADYPTARVNRDSARLDIGAVDDGDGDRVGTTQQPPTETKPHEDHDPEKHADYPTARVTVTV